MSMNPAEVLDQTYVRGSGVGSENLYDGDDSQITSCDEEFDGNDDVPLIHRHKQAGQEGTQHQSPSQREQSNGADSILGPIDEIKAEPDSDVEFVSEGAMNFNWKLPDVCLPTHFLAPIHPTDQNTSSKLSTK
jgi:hypothetical protein